MSRPSVLFFNRVYPPSRGATGRLLRDLSQAFARDGWTVTVITTGPRASRESDGAVRVVRVRGARQAKHKDALFFLWIRLFRAGLFSRRHDLIVTMTDPPLFVVAGRWLAAIKKSRHIHWCQDIYPDLLPVLNVPLSRRTMAFLERISNKALRRCDRIVTLGRCMARRLTQKGIAPGKISVIPNWADAELGASQKEKGAAGARKTRPQKNVRPFEQQRRESVPAKFRVLYAGNLGRSHPLRSIIQAAEILDRDHPEIEFVFVGDGPKFNRLAEIRSRRNLRNIRLMPFQPAESLRDLMESGDVHLISMKAETAGLLLPSKIYAALAVARPVIFLGPEQSDIARLLGDFGAGVTVPQDDGVRLAASILRYRENGEEWFAAHRGARDAGKTFVPRESLNAWLARARNVVGLPPRAG